MGDEESLEDIMKNDIAMKYDEAYKDEFIESLLEMMRQQKEDYLEEERKMANSINSITNAYARNAVNISSAGVSPPVRSSLESITEQLLKRALLAEFRRDDSEMVVDGASIKSLEDRIKKELIQHMLQQVQTKTKYTKLSLPEQRSTVYKAKVYVFNEEELKELIEKAYNA